MQLVRLACLVVVIACSAPARPPAPPPPPAAPAAAIIGDACTPDRASPQGTCGTGQLCMPAPGGYCTRLCGATGAACLAGSTCVPSPRGGELCSRTCARDADCRVKEGYVCDPGRKACMLPFQAAPVLAACGTPPPDGDFSKPVVLSTSASPGIYQFEPAAALTPAGDLVVVSTSAGSMFDPSFLTIARVPRAGAPVIDQPLPTSKRSHFDAWAAATSDGAVHAVWLGHDGGGVDRNAEIGYARSTDGGATWTAPVAIHDPADCPADTPFCMDKPMIAAGPVAGQPGREALRVFYSSETGGGMRMRTSLDGGKTWGGTTTASEGAYGDVAIDGKGQIHVVAALGSPRGQAALGSTDSSIAYTVSRDGATFGAALTVSAANESVPFFFVNPTIAVDDQRRWIYVAYAAGTPDGRWDIQLAATHDDGKTWRRTKVNDDPSCGNHMVPNLALDPTTGTLHLTYLENRGGHGHLAYVSCAGGGGPCTPAVRVSADMAAYELVRHSSKWLGEYASLLVDAKRRLLHAVWTETVQEGDRAIGRLRYATRALAR